MGYDYKIVSTLPDGKTFSTTYQKLIIVLGIDKEEYMGEPFTAGGTPQCQVVMEMTVKAMKGKVQKMDAYFNGGLILTTSEASQSGEEALGDDFKS